MRSSKKTGNMGEAVAAEYLRRKGYSIVARNVSRPWGEIDIIAVKGSIVHMVEVKAISCENIERISRESTEYRPEQHITSEKLRKLSRTAEMYMHEVRDAREYQIDAVGVYLERGSRRAKCRLYEQILA